MPQSVVVFEAAGVALVDLASDDDEVDVSPPELDEAAGLSDAAEPLFSDSIAFLRAAEG
jgi:hypothetical protein